jgi:hypothetical protein
MKRGSTLSFTVAMVALCGCATTITWRQREGLDYFIGKTDESLLDSLGEPTRRWSLESVQYIAFDYDENVWVAGKPSLLDPNTGAPLGRPQKVLHCFQTAKGSSDCMEPRR